MAYQACVFIYAKMFEKVYQTHLKQQEICLKMIFLVFKCYEANSICKITMCKAPCSNILTCMAAIVEKLAAVEAMTFGSSLVRISVRLSPKGMSAAWHLLMVEANTGKRKKARPQLVH